MTFKGKKPAHNRNGSQLSSAQVRRGWRGSQPGDRGRGSPGALGGTTAGARPCGKCSGRGSVGLRGGVGRVGRPAPPAPAPPRPRRACPYKVSAAPAPWESGCRHLRPSVRFPRRRRSPPASPGHPSKAAPPSAFLPGSAATPRFASPSGEAALGHRLTLGHSGLGPCPAQPGSAHLRVLELAERAGRGGFGRKLEKRVVLGFRKARSGVGGKSASFQGWPNPSGAC